MTWQTAITLHIVFGALFNILQREFSRKRLFDARVAAGLTLLVAWFLGSIYAAASGAVDFSFPSSIWIYTLVSGFLFAGGLTLRFKAVERIDAADMQLINNLSIIVGIGTVSIWLGEQLEGIEYLGAFLILAAAAITTQQRKATARVRRYLWIAVLSALVFGIATSFERYILLDMNIQTYFVIGWGFQTAWALAIGGRKLKQSIPRSWEEFAPIGLIGLSLFAAGSMYVAATHLTDNASIINSLRAVKIPLTLLAATYFLRERGGLGRKTISTVLAATGIVLIV